MMYLRSIGQPTISAYSKDNANYRRISSNGDANEYVHQITYPVLETSNVWRFEVAKKEIFSLQFRSECWFFGLFLKY